MMVKWQSQKVVECKNKRMVINYTSHWWSHGGKFHYNMLTDDSLRGFLWQTLLLENLPGLWNTSKGIDIYINALAGSATDVFAV